ncbi:uncharacterized protein LOC124154950 [Ischnura elegans]|uniref:uncharacterized protein LOC124154950 n=1 Tax=Ischnura elegans TaxID=197161 RepID=UPI001ED8B1F6|nr:uncharacterized protein LOC124154950 [Ischnura elegans]
MLLPLVLMSTLVGLIAAGPLPSETSNSEGNENLATNSTLDQINTPELTPPATIERLKIKAEVIEKDVLNVDENKEEPHVDTEASNPTTDAPTEPATDDVNHKHHWFLNPDCDPLKAFLESLLIDRATEPITALAATLDNIHKSCIPFLGRKT